MKIKTSELIGPALDWAVAVCEGYGPGSYCRDIDLRRDVQGKVTCMFVPVSRDYERWHPSTNWSQGGPIIEREGINLSIDYQDDALSTDMVPIGWKANLWNNSVPGTSGFLQWSYGPTPLIAAMRCYAACKLGDEIDVPEELM